VNLYIFAALCDMPTGILVYWSICWGILMLSGIEGKYFLSGYPDVIGNRIHIRLGGLQFKSARMVVGYNKR
jgi:hypothetical protein